MKLVLMKERNDLIKYDDWFFSFKDSKNVVLCFYPNIHLFACPSKKVFEMAKSVISVYPEIIATETVVFAISVDSVNSQSEFVKEYKKVSKF